MTPTAPLPPGLGAILPQTFLARVPPAVAHEVLATGRLVRVPARAALDHSRERPGLAVVVEGLVRAFLRSAEGRQVTVRYARPGETMGLVQLLGGRLDVHAQAVTASSLWTLSRRRLRALAEESPPLALAIAEECAARVGDAVEELALLTFGSVRQRVARHLLDLAAGEVHGDTLVVAATQQALADAAGTVREVVARELKALEKTGCIGRSAGGVVVLDAARLDREAR